MLRRAAPPPAALTPAARPATRPRCPQPSSRTRRSLRAPRAIFRFAQVPIIHGHYTYIPLQASPSAEVAPHVAAVAPVQFAPVNRLVPEFCPPTLTEDVTLALDARSLLHYWASTVHQAHQKPARAILKVLDGLVLSRPLDAIGWAYAALQLLGNEAVYFDPALVLSCDSSLSVAGAIAKRAMNVHSLEQLGRFCTC